MSFGSVLGLPLPRVLRKQETPGFVLKEGEGLRLRLHGKRGDNLDTKRGPLVDLQLVPDAEVLWVPTLQQRGPTRPVVHLRRTPLTHRVRYEASFGFFHNLRKEGDRTEFPWSLAGLVEGLECFAAVLVPVPGGPFRDAGLDSGCGEGDAEGDFLEDSVEDVWVVWSGELGAVGEGWHGSKIAEMRVVKVLTRSVSCGILRYR